MDFKVTYLDGGLGPITVNKNTDGLLQSACGYIVDINEASSHNESPTSTLTALTTSRTTTNKLNRNNKSERSSSCSGTDSRTSCVDLSDSVVTADNNNSTSNDDQVQTTRMTNKCHEMINSKVVRDNYANETNAQSVGRRGKYNTKQSMTHSNKTGKGNANKKLKASNTPNSSTPSAFEPIGSYGHGGRLAPDSVTSSNESTTSNSFLLGYNSTSWTSAAVNPYFGLDDPSTTTQLPENTMFPTHLAHHHQPGYHHPTHHHPATASSHISTLAGHSNSAALAAAAAVYYHSSYPGQDSSYFVTPPVTTQSATNYSSAEPVVATSNSNDLTSTTNTTNSSTNFATQSSMRPSTFFSAENLLHYGARHPLVSVNNTYHNGSGAAASASGTDIYSAAAAVAMHHHHGQTRQYPTGAAGYPTTHPYHAGTHYSMQTQATELTHYGSETIISNTTSINANNNEDTNYLRNSLVSGEFAPSFEHHNASSAYRFGGTYHPSYHHHQAANETYAGNAHHHHHHSLKLSNTSTGNASNNNSSTDANTFYGSAHLTATSEMPSTPFLGYGVNNSSSCRLAGSAITNVGGENEPTGSAADSSLTNLASFNQLHPLWNSFNMLTANLTLEHMKENTVSNNNIEMTNGIAFGETGDQAKFGRKRKAKDMQTSESLSLSLSVHPMTDTPPASASSSSSSSNAAIEELGAVARKHQSPDPIKEAPSLSHGWNNMCTQDNMTTVLESNQTDMMPNVTSG